MSDERLSASTSPVLSAQPGLGDGVVWWLVLVFLLPYLGLLAVLSGFAGVQQLLSRKWPLPEPAEGDPALRRA